jgi:hypothetical protein
MVIGSSITKKAVRPGESPGLTLQKQNPKGPRYV